MPYYKVSEYAELSSKTRQAIYALIKRGKIQATNISGVTYIYEDDRKEVPNENERV